MEEMSRNILKVTSPMLTNTTLNSYLFKTSTNATYVIKEISMESELLSYIQKNINIKINIKGNYHITFNPPDILNQNKINDSLPIRAQKTNNENNYTIPQSFTLHSNIDGNSIVNNKNFKGDIQANKKYDIIVPNISINIMQINDIKEILKILHLHKSSKESPYTINENILKSSSPLRQNTIEYKNMLTLNDKF